MYDPFCGGGSTLVEAQRLGLPAAGSDLNPVPVLITRTLTSLVPAVAGRPPLHPDPNRMPSGAWLDGLAADVRHYGERVRNVVWRSVAEFYPQGPNGEKIIAWLWTRTVTCPNPACRATAPLASSFWLSKRKGAPTWIEPVPDGGRVQFEVRTGRGAPQPSPKLGRGATFRCVTCGGLVPEAYVKAEGMDGRLGTQLMAIAGELGGRRVYLAPREDQEKCADMPRPEDISEVELPDYARWFSSPAFGLKTQADLYTNRQLTVLGAFADAVADVASWVRADGGDDDYGTAIASVLGLALGKLSQWHSTQVTWRLRTVESKAERGFSRQALPMTWDFAETNPFEGAVGAWHSQIASVLSALESLPPATRSSRVLQADARSAAHIVESPVLIATDPPYFGQIGYADLSDYFYGWLRRALRRVHPDLFRTIATPKESELIAAPYRHSDGKPAATRYFVEGFTEVFSGLARLSDPELPMLVVYAHRQEDSGDDGLTSTAWESMLGAILDAGLGIVGTWPVWAASSTKQISLGTNALASYIVLVCRPRPAHAGLTDTAGFLAALREELPPALRRLQAVNIPAVDLGQAAIGPGMAVFSRHSRVLKSDGTAMTVREALARINDVLDTVLAQQEGEFDNETRWAIRWFTQHGFDEGAYPTAEVLMTQTNTSTEGLRRAHIAVLGGGKVNLLDRDLLTRDWDPVSERRLTVWVVTQQLVRRLADGGEQAAADLLRQVGGIGDVAKELAYLLYSICERHRWATEAQPYNALITSWPEISRLAGAALRPADAVQSTLD